jgi:prolyl-tRNA synthetase
MKDSYSFDLDADGLDRSFDLHHQAYARSFERLGIPADRQVKTLVYLVDGRLTLVLLRGDHALVER